MDAFVVRANGPLSGTVRVCGATKNAGLKQMAAALLAPGVTVLRNLHPVLDLDAMLDVMRAIGASAEWTGENELTIDASGPLTPEAPYELVTRMRASINVLGPLLARCGEARVAMPGGDNIGSRKLDMHFRGLEAMGAEVFVRRRNLRIRRAVRHLEHGVPAIGCGLVGAEHAEIARVGVQPQQVANELALNTRRFDFHDARLPHFDRIVTEVRHAQLAQQNSAVGMRIGPHPPVAPRGEVG